MWDILHYRFKKGGNNLNENEKWPEIIEKIHWKYLYRPDTDFTQDDDNWETYESFNHYANIADSGYEKLKHEVESVFWDITPDEDKNILIENEINCLNKCLLNIIDSFSNNTQEFWLVSESCIWELLKPELEKTKYKVQKIIWNLHVVQ